MPLTPMELQALTSELGLQSPANPNIHAIRYDSRQVGPGDLYVAVPGTRTDGHAHIPAAIAAGAAAIVCDRSWHGGQQNLDPGVVWLAVANPRAALASLAAAFYRHPARELRMVGITGTNGKTTTAHLVSQLLQRQQLNCGWIGTLGAGYGDVSLPGQYTTPFPPELHAILRQMADDGVRAVAMECSSHALDQHRLDAIAYDAAIFTNLTQDHLDYHQTLEAYAEAKSLLFSHLLKPDGTAIVNADDPAAGRFAAAARGRVLRYGIEAVADLQARELAFHAEGVGFSLFWQGRSQPVRLRLPGRYNVHNALAAVATALSLGLPLDESLAALEQISGVPGRLERVSPDGHSFAVYVDYAHTPDSLENALKAVRQFTAGRVLVVFGCGGDRDRGKRPLMGAAAETLADRVFVTSDNPRSEQPEAIIAEILAGLKSPQVAVVEPMRREAIALALEAARPGDVVLIAGKGHENYQIIGDQTLHFDDREEARQFLAGRMR
ncbi:MAG: UDP-N-acetylmuramoyl-L-alanyl-D-glutamate--2,6-diaminopimelate ligase [Candidatus Sericytochromatia bacterium]